MSRFIRFILLPLILGLVVGAASASTTVTGTVTDPDSTAWANGSITFTLNGTSSQYACAGVVMPSSQTTVTLALNGSGAFSGSICPNSTITPVSTQWAIRVCSATTAPCQSITPTTVSGSSQSLTSYINSLIKAIRVPITFGVTAYTDTEIVNPPKGGTYFNLISGLGRFWNGTAWANNSSSGAYCPLTGCTLTGPLGIAVTGGVAGNFYLTQGTLPGAIPANSILLTVPTSVTSYNLVFPGTAPTVNGQVQSCTTAGICSWLTVAAGSVASIANSDGSLTISPTTGAAIASLNPNHANTWGATQNFAFNSGGGGFTIFPVAGNAFYQMSGAGGDTWQPFADSLGSGHSHSFGFYNVTQTVEPFAVSGGTAPGTWFGLPTVGALGWTSQSQFPDNDATLETAFWRISAHVVSLGSGATAGDATGTFKVANILAGVLYSAAGTALPTCVTGLKGQSAVVIDATSPTYLGAYVPSGAVVAPVLCNGTIWVTN